ncbi:MAG: hypothetical protein ABIG11_08575 [bacterium]
MKKTFVTIALVTAMSGNAYAAAESVLNTLKSAISPSILETATDLIPSFPSVQAAKTATIPTAAELNNLNDPKDPRIKLGMFNNLQKAGIKMPLTDVRELIKPDAEETLLKLGFRLEPRTDGIKVYTLGNAQLYSNGQRAVFNKDGSVNLVSFSQPGGGRPIVEVIKLDAAGNISNSVQMIP